MTIYAFGDINATEDVTVWFYYENQFYKVRVTLMFDKNEEKWIVCSIDNYDAPQDAEYMEDEIERDMKLKTPWGFYQVNTELIWILESADKRRLVKKEIVEDVIKDMTEDIKRYKGVI